MNLIRTPLKELRPGQTIGARDLDDQKSCISCTVVMVDDGLIYATPNHKYAEPFVFYQETGISVKGTMEIFLTPNRRQHEKEVEEDRRITGALKWD